MIDDKTLIARVVLADDHHAFATLVRRYQQAIRQFLRRLTSGDQALADDLAQEVFTTLYHKIASYRSEASFGTWLHSIAYRTFLNEKRKSHYANEVPYSDAIIEPMVASNAEKDLLVESLINRLGLAERTCITLAYSAGMSHQEIMEITQLPLGTVKSNINRGKKKVETWLHANQITRSVS
ncbi:RNA polymerase sigma factor [Bowmanella pacifica]|uniref:RNA polymerase sigma factor n=1 Tax=Bowmanella pacifica TaxID=502051 RepID=A0A918DH42_9ALTE|nr:sigma-70 family RNA polymerase sigma factor [Bowmanella pacifica]GGO65829.1 RNA polymerase sigma factor [Bowmanella pacifica]